MIRRARLLAVLAILIAGALGVISSTQTWLTVTLAEAADHPLLVPGASAIPVLAPLSLAVLALGLALSIVGVMLRYAFGVLTLAIGGLLVFLTAQVAFTQPVSAVASTVTSATGISGTTSVAKLVGSIAVTPWPFVTLLGWILLVVVGVFTLATARQWRGGGRKYRTDAPLAVSDTAAAGPLDPIDSWDGLSRGEDPTGSSDRR
ncbi:MAG: Trp biosynthesis-associated membrane protein [Actinobacteria bacterium]|nr:Trp biosynthesis-associated membrane protein [Actinomycetota bacterium]